MKSPSPLHRSKRQWTSSSLLAGAFALAFCAVTIPLGQTRAQDVYEGFDYPDGTALDGQDGGTGWGGEWSAGLGDDEARHTIDFSLNYPGIASTGNKLEIEGSRIFRTLDTELIQGNTYYIRVLMQKDPGEDSMSYFGLMLENDMGTEKLLIGSVTGFSHWMLGGNFGAGAGVTAGEVYPPGHADEGDPRNTLTSTVPNTELALLVVKLEMRDVTAENPDGLEQLTFWVNPDLSLAEDVTTAVGGRSFPSFTDYGLLSRVRVGGGGSDAAGTKHYTDEIRISQESPFPGSAYRPDLQIGKKASPTKHKGDGLYNDSGAGQTLQVKLRDRKNGNPRKAKFFFLAENDGNAVDNLLLRGKKSGKQIKTKYFRISEGRQNVTGALLTGRLTLDDLRPGEQVRFLGMAKFKKNAKKKRKKIVYRAYSQSDASQRDAAKAVLKRKKR